MRRLSLLVTLLILSLIAGCGNQSAPAATGQSQNGEKKVYTIGVLIPNLPDPFHQSVYYGIWQRAKDLGNVRVVMYDAGGFSNVSKQVSQMDDLLQYGVDAIILNPTNTSAMVPSVDKARDKGKPMILYGSVVNTKYTSFIAADQKQLGGDQAKYMVDELKGKGKIALIPGPAGVSWAIDREKAFRDYIQAHSQIEVVAEKWTDSTRQAGLSTLEDLLQAHPEINGVYTGTDYLADGAAQAAKAAGVAGKLVITTSVMSPDTQALIEDGSISMTSAQQSVLIGSTALQVAVDVLAGKSVNPTYPIDDVYVTKANVRQIDKSTINAPTGWKPPQNLNA